MELKAFAVITSPEGRDLNMLNGPFKAEGLKMSQRKILVGAVPVVMLSRG